MDAFRNTSTVVVPCFALVVSAIVLGGSTGDVQGQVASNATPSVFELPIRQAEIQELQKRMLLASRVGNSQAAEDVAAAAVKRMPGNPVTHYNLGCMQAINGKTEEAFKSLRAAIETGFRNPKILSADSDLKSLHEDDRFQELLKATAIPFESKSQGFTAAPVKNGVGTVTAENTQWVPQRSTLVTHFKVNADALKKMPPVRGQGAAGALVQKWYAEGTACGLVGDLYDNHDHDHSNMAYKDFPQLTRIEYGPEPRKFNITNGLQRFVMFNGATIGNSSTANVGGPFWRSMTRLFMVDPRLASQTYNQYLGNHIYFYPEHRDYDPGQFGDTFPANTSFVITSQGSSYSDKPFMNAVACTMAAFRPDVKKALLQNGILTPTVQMIFRYCNKPVQSDDKYLTGSAHPAVFDSKQLDVEKMVRMAHDIQSDAVPPVIQMKLVNEDRGIAGRDYFHTSPSEALFTTPAAIARVYRTLKPRKTMVVDVSGSRDINKRDLTFTWKVLQGDRNKVKVRPLNENGSLAEITFYYHPRTKIEGSSLESNRIDVGVFAYNGKYYSAPGFVTSYSIASEYRRYNKNGSIESIDYSHPKIGKLYTDPAITSRKDWRDEYSYDADGKNTGWTRYRDGADPDQFSWNGILVTQRDALKRPALGKVPNYAVGVVDQYPTVTQTATETVVRFEYESDADRFGKIVRSEDK